MSLNYLPLPVYVSLCLFLSIALILIAVKRRNVDRKGLLVLYLIGSAGGILATIIRILKERTSIYDDYFNQIGYILFGYIIIPCGNRKTYNPHSAGTFYNNKQTSQSRRTVWHKMDGIVTAPLRHSRNQQSRLHKEQLHPTAV